MAKQEGKEVSRITDKRNPYSTYWRRKASLRFMNQYHNAECAVCGKTEGTIGHHIISVGSCAFHRYTKINILPLCPEHHTISNAMAPHSTNSTARDVFNNWLKATYPDRHAWKDAHRFDTGRINHREIFLGLAGGGEQ